MSEKNQLLQTYQSPYSVAETLQKIEAILKEKGINIFARIKFSEDAKKAGLTIPEQEMLVFGDPKTGTYLMQENPTIGLELPLKILVWQSKQGTTQVGYLQPSIMAKPFAINQTQTILEKMDQLLPNIVKAAII